MWGMKIEDITVLSDTLMRFVYFFSLKPDVSCFNMALI